MPAPDLIQQRQLLRAFRQATAEPLRPSASGLLDSLPVRVTICLNSLSEA
jgi:hypothetical protein